MNIDKYTIIEHTDLELVKEALDILWEYISEKDLNEINEKLEEL